MLTIREEIKKNEQKSDKTYNVKLRFTLNRKIKRLSTTIFVTPKDLTKEFKIKQSSPFYKEVNDLICDYQEKCAKLQIDLNEYTVEDIIDCLNGEQVKSRTIDFIQFSREWIASADIKGAANYTSAVNALVRFIGKEELDVKLITTDFLERFKEFLNDERKKREKMLTCVSFIYLVKSIKGAIAGVCSLCNRFYIAPTKFVITNVIVFELHYLLHIIYNGRC